MSGEKSDDLEEKSYLYMTNTPPPGVHMAKSAPILKSKPSAVSFYSDTRASSIDLPYVEKHVYVPINDHGNKDKSDGMSPLIQYRYELSRRQLKASSNISALLAGFAMVALVELHYPKDTPHSLLILLAIVTTLLVSVHLLALMMSTCILPYIEATGCTNDSPHMKLKFYIELSWIFSTCIGLVLFLLEIVLIFYMKFLDINFELGGYITTIMLIPVFILFGIISYLIHRTIVSYTIGKGENTIDELTNILSEKEDTLHKSSQPHIKFGLHEVSKIVEIV